MKTLEGEDVPYTWEDVARELRAGQEAIFHSRPLLALLGKKRKPVFAEPNELIRLLFSRAKR
jgi:hypothetical protein